MVAFVTKSPNANPTIITRMTKGATWPGVKKYSTHGRYPAARSTHTINRTDRIRAVVIVILFSFPFPTPASIEQRRRSGKAQHRPTMTTPRGTAVNRGLGAGEAGRPPRPARSYTR